MKNMNQYFEESIIQVAEFSILLRRKPIKNVYLRILPNDGSIQISAPLDMSDEAAAAFAQSHLTWIRQKTKELNLSYTHFSPPQNYITGETHYVWGHPMYLDVITTNIHPYVELYQTNIHMYVHPNSSIKQRKALLFNWYRSQLKAIVPQILSHWEPVMNVHCCEFHIKIMKTRWGTCNTSAGRIWINLYLAQKPLECLEYVIVHELCHLIEPSHSKRFYHYLELFLPDWKARKTKLNQFPQTAE
ncbi:MAG: SprT family zinc-dependent metalloprotease [Lachnospiraceae bacterium]|nr:SprT family zinc-dependent metalloprotease [Lachnospiraceae bacterium]